MIKWYKKVVFENYVNFKGRARRSEFWYFNLMSIILLIVAIVLDKMLGINFKPLPYGYFYTGIALASFLPGLAVSVRRLHDVGKSGKLLLLFFFLYIIVSVVIGVTFALNLVGGGMSSNSMLIPAISGAVLLGLGIWMLILMCTTGNEGTNKYGNDPKLIGEEINEIGTV